MTVHMIVVGTRRPGTDERYAAYGKAAGPLFLAAGGVRKDNYQQVGDNLAGAGPELVAFMEFPDEAAVRSVFASEAYQATIPDRDAAFERLDVIVATA